ncbi:MAG: hypothetical protein BWY71_02201 [Planctomycetes bacterium ADurb.Bin412]|nr:MAG: hypothetical protein BWY71_02201 [Planctomycetes bacterium ADurb.Bin412]
MCGGLQAEFIQFIVDAEVFFNVGIAHGHIGLGLVVVVVRNKISHGIVREELFEFSVQLGYQCFVMRDHQGRPLRILYHVGHGECFTAAGNAEQGLVFFAGKYAFRQLADGFRLVAGGRKGGMKLKRHKEKAS